MANRGSKIYAQFATLDEKIKKLEEKRGKLRGDIVIDIMNQGLPGIENEYGTFTLKHITTYEYTSKVKQAADKLALMKKKEVLTKKAKIKSDYTTMAYSE